MHRTKNDLPEVKRRELVALLNERLADSVDLLMMSKQAHWNVKGPTFIALHKMFDEMYDVIAGFVDTIAERVVQLGGTAMGTVRASAAATTLAEYPADIINGHDHCDALSSALARYGAAMRKAIDQASALGDADTADIFTEISRGTDKWTWFVEAHLEGKA